MFSGSVRMDRRRLFFCIWFGLCLPNVRAQEAGTPVSAPAARPDIAGYQAGLRNFAKAAQEPFDGITAEKTANQYDERVVAGDGDANPRQMAQLIRGDDGLAESLPPITLPPHHMPAQLRTVLRTGGNMTAEEAIHKLDITGPLTRISLSSALRRESVKGTPLKEPHNDARKTFAAVGVQYEHSFARQFRPNRNLHPIWYKPLYFEDPNLERCGKGVGVFNEALSAVRFFGRVPALPTMLANNPPCQCVRALPDCPTCHKFGHETYLSVPEPDGALLQIAATVGLIFLIP
jgi:hypothetical protein